MSSKQDIVDEAMLDQDLSWDEKNLQKIKTDTMEVWYEFKEVFDQHISRDPNIYNGVPTDTLATEFIRNALENKDWKPTLN